MNNTATLSNSIAKKIYFVLGAVMLCATLILGPLTHMSAADYVCGTKVCNSDGIAYKDAPAGAKSGSCIGGDNPITLVATAVGCAGLFVTALASGVTSIIGAAAIVGSILGGPVGVAVAVGATVAAVATVVVVGVVASLIAAAVAAVMTAIAWFFLSLFTIRW